MNLRLAERWKRMGNRGPDVGVMLLFALLAGLFLWGAHAMAYPEHGCVRMGKGNSGPLQCSPRQLLDNARWLLLLGVLAALPVVYIVWGWILAMARPLPPEKQWPE
ncbi:hypothetical protein ACTUVK_001191 [Stenotrophomonas rhizophila]